MIKAVLFDYGGVLTEGGKAGSVVQTYARMYGLKPEEVHGEQIRDDWFLGKITADEFFAQLNQLHPDRPAGSKELFRQYNLDVFVRAEPIRALAAALRQAGVKTGILSDAVAFISDEHKRRGDYNGFDPVVLSNAEGLMKPDPGLYKRALAKLQLPASEVLFIDDQERCLVPARQIGMHTILAQSPEQIVRDVRKLLKTENELEF